MAVGPTTLLMVAEADLSAGVPAGAIGVAFGVLLAGYALGVLAARLLRMLARTVARRVLGNPIVIAIVLGLVVAVSGWQLPRPVASTVELIGAMAAPGGLFALGILLRGAVGALRGGRSGGIAVATRPEVPGGPFVSGARQFRGASQSRRRSSWVRASEMRSTAAAWSALAPPIATARSASAMSRSAFASALSCGIGAIRPRWASSGSTERPGASGVPDCLLTSITPRMSAVPAAQAPHSEG